MSNIVLSNRVPASQAGVPAKARVKWFNPDKGFGFVAPLDGTPDAFVHVSVLQRNGMTQLVEGSEIVCEIGAGPKGPQVLRVVEAATVVPGDPGAAGDLPALRGAVKWFAPEKGFGFVAADDGGKDVFVHKSVLRRCGLQALNEGQRVQVTTSATPKGREAVWIQVE